MGDRQFLKVVVRNIGLSGKCVTDRNTFGIVSLPGIFRKVKLTGPKYKIRVLTGLNDSGLFRIIRSITVSDSTARHIERSIRSQCQIFTDGQIRSSCQSTIQSDLTGPPDFADSKSRFFTDSHRHSGINSNRVDIQIRVYSNIDFEHNSVIAKV